MSEKKSIIQELLQCKPVNYRSDFTKITESITAGVMLSQSFYWDGKSTKRTDGFFEKDSNEMYDETGLTDKQQRTARGILEAQGLMDFKRGGDRGKMCYRVNFQKVELALIQFYSDRQNGSSAKIGNKAELHRQNGSSKNSEMADLSLQRILTENTTENTTTPIGDGFALNHDPEVKPSKRKNTYPAKEMADIFEKGYPALHAGNKFPWGKESGKWGKAFQRIWELSGENMDKVRAMAADLYRRIKNAKPTDLFWKEAGFTPTTLSSRWHQLQPVKAVEDMPQPFPDYHSMSLEQLEETFNDWTARFDLGVLKKNISPDSFSRYMDREDGNGFAPNLARILDRENRERDHKKSA